ncbi:mannosyl-3-phosphoglycerate phosphatase [Thermococcus sp.]
MRIIFLDIDKTLVGEDYSPEPAESIIRWLQSKNFEIILNSSKTKAEQEYYRKALDIRGPFIVENGSAIYIPEDYFPFEIQGLKRESYYVLEFGERYQRIRNILDSISRKFGLKYYGNSTLKEIMAFTGLPKELARLAMIREYSETVFQWNSEGFISAVEYNNLRVSRGSRFFNIHGRTDKGKAALALISLYQKMGEVRSYAVGDAPNDFSLLDTVDHAYLVGNLIHAGARNINSIEELKEVIP